MKITKRQLKKIINEYHPRPDDDYDPLNPDDDEDDAAYDQGFDDGFNGYPSNPVVGGDYHVGYEEGVNAAKDEASREDDPEEFGPGSPGMMGPPRREGKIRLTKRQLRRIIREQAVIDKTVPEHFDSGENIDVYGYATKNFDVCASVVDLFEDDLAGAKFLGTERMIVEAAKLADKIFALEKRAVRKGFSTYDDTEKARELHQEFKDLIKELCVSDYNDKIAFMKMHLREITKREE